MSITLDQVTKRYQGIPVVNDVSLEIGDGEFFVLLGPSGSGKSTLLRAIAGLTGIDHGRMFLHGRDVTHVSPRERGVGLVFQNYALFRHMTVAENIEFALRVRRMKAADRRQRRKELLRLVALEGMDDRLPSQLSGGQQQRVAVARALAHKPEVLLLDEPFGALDAKIREELRRTIRQVQRELGITTVLVTHDQEEAFALADRIGVMNLGRLLETGKPTELYAWPKTRFVATFLGAANLLLARQTPDGICFGDACVGGSERAPSGTEHEVITVLRPEEIEIAATRDALRSTYLGRGVIEDVVFSGALERIRVRLDDATQAARVIRLDTDDPAQIEVTRTQHERRVLPIATGQQVVLGIRNIHVLRTPLSSFTACAPSAAHAEELRNQPLLAELAARMRTRVSIRVEPVLENIDAPCSSSRVVAGFNGTTVIASQPGVARQVEWLMKRGAQDILVLPRHARPPRRVLIHWTGNTARRATMAVSASLLRHASAEAVYVGILPENAQASSRAAGMRALLDARSEAKAEHGLEMRTELLFGDSIRELTRLLQELPEQLLVLGVDAPGEIGARLSPLFESAAACPVLVVHRPAEARA